MELAPRGEELWYIAREILRIRVSCKPHSKGWKRKGLVALEASLGASPVGLWREGVQGAG